jgi:hypothetical protein
VQSDADEEDVYIDCGDGTDGYDTGFEPWKCETEVLACFI